MYAYEKQQRKRSWVSQAMGRLGRKGRWRVRIRGKHDGIDPRTITRGVK
jgi:hypothetical protein